MTTIHAFPINLRVRARAYSDSDYKVTGYVERYVLCERTEGHTGGPYYYMPHELEPIDVRDITAGPATSRRTWETTR